MESFFRDKDEYVNKLLKNIETLKSKGHTVLYLMNEKVLDSTVAWVTAYFKENPSYDIETRKCSSCDHTWDIIIRFL